MRTSTNERDLPGASAAERSRAAPLAIPPEEFRRIGHELVDRIAGMLGDLGERPVTSGATADAIRKLIAADAPLPRGGTDPETLLRQTTDLLLGHSLFSGHPRFLGYIIGSPAPIGMLAELLAAAVNPNVGAWTLAPVATEIELQTVRWIAELLGFPTDCGGLLVSGGNMANTAALIAARADRAGWNIRASGMHGSPAGWLRVYCSAETHTWVQKATDIAGLGTAAIRWIPTDGALRMDVAALRRAIEVDVEAGDRPMMVVGTAGSVSTGAVDPLDEIAAVCREHGAWFHVDGAYGGFAAALPDAPAALRALAEADSIAVDPHKWLYAPLEAGCVLVRNRGALRDAFSYRPPYYHLLDDVTNFVDLGPQNSRGFRALKVWLALRQIGRDGYVRSIGDDIRLSERLHERLAAHPEFETVTQGLSITTFRYVPAGIHPTPAHDGVDGYLDALNRGILERLERSGEAFVSNAVIRGRYLLRACVVNFNTTERDVDALPGIIARIGDEAHREMLAADAAQR